MEQFTHESLLTRFDDPVKIPVSHLSLQFAAFATAEFKDTDTSGVPLKVLEGKTLLGTQDYMMAETERSACDPTLLGELQGAGVGTLPPDWWPPMDFASQPWADQWALPPIPPLPWMDPLMAAQQNFYPMWSPDGLPETDFGAGQAMLEFNKLYAEAMMNACQATNLSKSEVDAVECDSSGCSTADASNLEETTTDDEVPMSSIATAGAHCLPFDRKSIARAAEQQAALAAASRDLLSILKVDCQTPTTRSTAELDCDQLSTDGSTADASTLEESLSEKEATTDDEVPMSSKSVPCVERPLRAWASVPDHHAAEKQAACAAASRDLLSILKVDFQAPTRSPGELESDQLSTDDILLIQMEERESKESGADEWNDETFGPGAGSDSWDFNSMISAHADLELGPPGMAPVPLDIEPPPGLSLQHRLAPVSAGLQLVPPGMAPVPLDLEPPPGLPLQHRLAPVSPKCPLVPAAPPGLPSQHRLAPIAELQASFRRRHLPAAPLGLPPAPPAEQPCQQVGSTIADVVPCGMQESISATNTHEKMLPCASIDESAAASKLNQDAISAVNTTEGVLPHPSIDEPLGASKLNQEESGARTPEKPLTRPALLRSKEKAKRQRQQTKVDRIVVDSSLESREAPLDKESTDGDRFGWRSVIALVVILSLMVGVPCLWGLFASSSRHTEATVRPGTSNAWNTVEPREAMRAQSVDALLRNMDLESVRAQAVAAHVKGKVQQVRQYKRTLKQQKALQAKARQMQGQQGQMRVTLRAEEGWRTQTVYLR